MSAPTSYTFKQTHALVYGVFFGASNMPICTIHLVADVWMARIDAMTYFSADTLQVLTDKLNELNGATG